MTFDENIIVVYQNKKSFFSSEYHQSLKRIDLDVSFRFVASFFVTNNRVRVCHRCLDMFQENNVCRQRIYFSRINDDEKKRSVNVIFFSKTFAIRKLSRVCYKQALLFRNFFHFFSGEHVPPVSFSSFFCESTVHN